MRKHLIGAALLVVGLACAIALGTRDAGAGTTIYRNGWERPRSYVVIDTLAVPAGGRRSIYLIVPSTEPTTAGVRAPVDTLVNLWVAGGAAPAFRHFQHLRIWPVGGQVSMGLTLFDEYGTSRMAFTMDNFVPYDFAAEGDSGQVTNPLGVPQTILYEVW